MFDIFTEEIEVQIKLGLSNLYWYRKDLKKAWLRSGVELTICDSLFSRHNDSGGKPSKRELMDFLYEEIRNIDFNRKLEISRNFVRFLVEHENFVPQDPKHRIEIAERCALKLKEIIKKQEKDRAYKEEIRRRKREVKRDDYYSHLEKISKRFIEIAKLEGQKRGYELERIFADLMKVSNITVEQPFRIVGEQIDGAIKYEGHYYLIELKWTERKAGQSDISSLYLKAEGKKDAYGIFISMNNYSNEVLSALPKGKRLKVLLLDGNHLANVISGIYTFQQLLDHANKYATLRGEIYCPHDISK